MKDFLYLHNFTRMPENKDMPELYKKITTFDALDEWDFISNYK